MIVSPQLIEPMYQASPLKPTIALILEVCRKGESMNHYDKQVGSGELKARTKLVSLRSSSMKKLRSDLSRKIRSMTSLITSTIRATRVRT